MNIRRMFWTDRKVETIIGNLLRFGVIFSGAVVLIGAVLYLVKYGLTTPHLSQFAGEPFELTNVGGIFRSALELRPRGLIQLGLVILIATPVARVVFSVIAFFFEKDRMYVVITLIVLLILSFSLSGGHF